jgi:hypothetical protein
MPLENIKDGIKREQVKAQACHKQMCRWGWVHSLAPSAYVIGNSASG